MDDPGFFNFQAPNLDGSPESGQREVPCCWSHSFIGLKGAKREATSLPKAVNMDRNEWEGSETKAVKEGEYEAGSPGNGTVVAWLRDRTREKS